MKRGMIKAGCGLYPARVCVCGKQVLRSVGYDPTRGHCGHAMYGCVWHR